MLDCPRLHGYRSIPRPGMAIALIYTRYRISSPRNLTDRKMTTFPHLLFSNAQEPFGLAHLQVALLESLLVTLVVFFWLTALPLGAVFSVAVSVYNRIVAFRSTTFRPPYMRSHLATRPLALRRRASASGTTSLRTLGHSHIARG